MAGPELDFISWTRALVMELRRKLPDVKAVRKGRVVTLSRGDRRAVIEDRDGTFWGRIGDGGPQGFTLAVSEHKTAETAANCAVSIATHFR